MLAVPLIEPTAVAIIIDPVQQKAIDDARNRPAEQLDEFAWCFKTGDWELDTPLVLESPDGKLLMKKYTVLPDGRVELKPCTMIFLSRSADLPEEERRRRAMILRAPQGAILEFDTPFDLRQARIGKLVGGQLLGEVTIHSDQRSPGPEDDLFIATRDVKLTETEITTPERVDFRLGPNFGRGRDLIVHLRPKNAPKPDLATSVNFGGMTSLELLHDVNMHLQSDGGDIFPGSKRSKPKDNAAVQNSAVKTAPTKPQPPVEVKCDGKFRFDAERYVAVFHRNVDVLRLNPMGPSDQLTCEILSLFFEATPAAPADAAKTASQSNSSKKTPSSAKLEPARIEARGNPVVVRAPSNGVQARGQELDYNIKTGVGNLRDGKDVYFLQGRNEIHARELIFQPGQNSRLGQFKASGPGWFKGTVPNESRDRQAAPAQPNQTAATQTAEKPLEARWTRHLHFRPHEQNQLLSIEGAAHVQSAATGAIDADQIHLWLLEPPAGSQPENSTKTGGPGGLQPDRLLALGHVRIDSPQLTGRVERLETWFEQLSPAVAARPKQENPRAELPVDRLPPPHLAGPILSPPRGPQLPIPRPRVPQNPAMAQGPNAAAPFPSTAAQAPAQILVTSGTQPAHQAAAPLGLPGLANAAGGGAEAPRSRYHVDGELLRAQITRRGETSELSELVVQRKVRFIETKTENPDELPLKLTGDQLHLIQPQPNAALVTITGDLAHVEARGMTMDGGTIRLDQGKNRLWIDGKGVMTLPVNRNLEGQPVATGGRLEVSWQGRMDFNGVLAVFERGVVARHERDLLRTEVLEVTLDRQVHFEAGVNGQRPEVQHLACRGGAYLESHKVDKLGKPLSIDKLQTKDLDVDQQSGSIKGQGPGWLSSVRWSDGQTIGPPGPAQPGQMPAGAPPGLRQPAGQAVAAPKPKKEQLVFLAVEFQRRMSGNLHHKNMLFEQQVRTVYGNVQKWDDTLDPNAPEALRPGDVLLTSQQLAVNETPGQMSGPGTPHYMELAATGNARVDGKTEAGMDFYSQSARLTYSQIKDLLVLQGDGRTDARLFRQTRIGGPMSEAAAGSIMYWRSTNTAQVGDFQFLDLSELPGGQKRR